MLRPPAPDARLYRKGKGKEAKLSYIGNALTENRHGLVVKAELGSATGTIEREAAMTIVVRHSPGSRRLTLGANKAYDVHGFVDDLRPQPHAHIAQNTTSGTSAIDAHATRHPGYAISQQKRKRTEEPFGWGKTIGGLARPILRGVARLRFKFILKPTTSSGCRRCSRRPRDQQEDRIKLTRRLGSADLQSRRDLGTNFSGLLSFA
jgi:hypothetical protein